MADERDALVGTVVGDRYELQSLLGRGGMASVYRAHDRSLGRDVAVKVFATAEVDQNAMRRESGEIRLLASLNHHALVTLFDAAVDAAATDRAYFVMELVEGPTLGERIASGPVEQSDVALMLHDLADALHVVHQRGVVHRDIKPANILLGPSASPRIGFRAKLSDFGIAYVVDSTRLTTPGTIVGTAAYVSPEQATGGAPGPQSDVYSLGLVALESLTGVRAFPGSLVESLSARRVGDPVIPASLGAAWGALLDRMTAREPERRPTALEVADAARDLERTLHSPTTADLDATLAVDAEKLASTRAMPEPTRVMSEPTRVMPEPTRVMPDTEALASTRAYPAPSPVGEAPTERLDAPATHAAPADDRPSRTRRPLPRRVYVALAGIVVIVAALVVGLAIAPDAAPEPTDKPTLTENGGDLGTHLDQLLESVTP
jgi:serine/threonine protein kinase